MEAGASPLRAGRRLEGRRDTGRRGVALTHSAVTSTQARGNRSAPAAGRHRPRPAVAPGLKAEQQPPAFSPQQQEFYKHSFHCSELEGQIFTLSHPQKPGRLVGANGIICKMTNQ